MSFDEHGDFGFDDSGPEQPDANQAPEFTEGASTFRVVEENTMALMGASGGDDADDDAIDEDNVADNVGEPVTATDADGDTPTYTLGGADKDMFRIRTNGQIEVGAKAMLDYETKSTPTWSRSRRPTRPTRPTTARR